jgi:hypothetical protein
MFETDPKQLKKKKIKVEAEFDKSQKKSATRPLRHLLQTVGNQVVQRLVAQRSSEGGFELDDEIAQRIQTERSGGEALDVEVRNNLGEKFNEDFSGVRVHAGSEADSLNRELGARAFTTGRDIFFRGGAYDPSSEGGQRLIAHELTHVLQQGGSAAEEHAPLRVNPPGDVFEQEADSLADRVITPGVGGLQRQETEEEEAVQMQEEEEEEEEELVQLQTEEEEYPYSTLKGTLPEESMPGEAGASTVDTTAKGTELDETIAGEVKPLSDETTAKPTETDLTLPEEEEMTATGKFAEEEEISPVTK